MGQFVLSKKVCVCVDYVGFFSEIFLQKTSVTKMPSGLKRPWGQETTGRFKVQTVLGGKGTVWPRLDATSDTEEWRKRTHADGIQGNLRHSRRNIGLMVGIFLLKRVNVVVRLPDVNSAPILPEAATKQATTCRWQKTEWKWVVNQQRGMLTRDIAKFQHGWSVSGQCCRAKGNLDKAVDQPHITPSDAWDDPVIGVSLFSSSVVYFLCWRAKVQTMEKGSITLSINLHAENDDEQDNIRQ